MLKKTKYFRLKNQDSTIKTHWTPKKHQNDVHSGIVAATFEMKIGYTTKIKFLNKLKINFWGNKGDVLMVSERANSVFYFCSNFSTSHIWYCGTSGFYLINWLWCSLFLSFFRSKTSGSFLGFIMTLNCFFHRTCQLLASWTTWWKWSQTRWASLSVSPFRYTLSSSPS